MVPHTTTGEWQSFEGRMRQRRAQRLAMRADVAAGGGCVDEAREALAEARKLAPRLAELDRVEQKLNAAARAAAPVDLPLAPHTAAPPTAPADHPQPRAIALLPQRDEDRHHSPRILATIAA